MNKDSRVDVSVATSPFDLDPAAGSWSSIHIENRGDRPVQNPNVLEAGQVDLSDLRNIVAAAVEPGMSDADKAMALFHWLVECVRSWALPNPEGNGNPVQILNVYGYCNCGGFGTTFATLASLAGLEARIVGMPGHCVAEVLLDGRWRIFDPSLNAVYSNDDGTLAGVDDIHQDPRLLDRASHRFHAPDTFNMEAVRALYAKKEAGFRPPPMPDAFHSMSYTLHPEESLQWYADDRARYFPYQNEYYMTAPPRGVYSGGTFFYRPDFGGDLFARRWTADEEAGALRPAGRSLSVTQPGAVGKLRMRWQFPWAVVGGRVRLHGYRTPKDGQVRFKLNRPERTVQFGGILTDNEELAGEFSAVMDFTRAAVLPPPAQVLFEVDLELQLLTVRAGSELRIDGLKVEVDLQRSPRSLPPNGPERRTLRYSDASAQRDVRVTIVPG